jgi:hypothetical protein
MYDCNYLLFEFAFCSVSQTYYPNYFVIIIKYYLYYKACALRRRLLRVYD